MSERQIEFQPQDEPLRDDVRTLGALVGEIISEQGGEALFAAVEAARTAAIQRREQPSSENELEGLLAELAPELVEQLVRSFSTYFQVVNLAEKAHRIRRRRDYLREGIAQRGSFEDALRQLQAAGVGLEAVRELLQTLVIEPVFTAHPTEATRRVILEKHQAITRRLVERMDPTRTPPEETVALERIRGQVTSGWQTEEHPAIRPTVAEELESVLFYVTDVIYRVVPPFYESLREALEKVYGAEAGDLEIPTLLRFCSWVGGDMDGNPNVTAATLQDTLREHRERILQCYTREVAGLARHLTQSSSRATIDPEIERRIELHAAQVPDALEEVSSRQRDMPYRVLLHLMRARLERTRRDAEGGYASFEDFEDDLRSIAHSLQNNQGQRAGLFAVRRLQRRVETFGFHLATLDVRQDGEVHRSVIGRILGDERWGERSADERAERLRQELAKASASQAPPAVDPEDAEATAVLEVFRALREARARYGRGATGLYIISMARAVDDVLSVLLLARWAGLVEPSEPADEDVVPLDVAPLFETVPDLESAADTMNALLADATYRRHLEARGERQVVMVGYSDSNKDGGLAASRWALTQGQTALVEAHRAQGVKLTIFHGRGGSISRGGGKTRRAVLAAPRGSVAGRLRLTEQGEVINAKYGVRGIALRTLEQAAGAVAIATSAPPPVDPREAEWAQIMESIASHSRATYRALVYEDPAFIDYFRRATPIDVIERMLIGSRPSARRSRAGIENLRAIPWVFAWTQSRHILPGWYGLGSGLENAVTSHGQQRVAEMVRDWPFLRAMISDVEMVLAKADLPIAARYAELAGEPGAEIFARICDEYQRTTELVRGLAGIETLLDGDPNLQRSIRLRNPYVDPMSLLQVDLLRRWRASERTDDSLLRALISTVHGIAQGLQNTG
ncbi:MAG: phosphoenolpyruvate carboxylase [Acidobacteriota bacterium]